jgi:uncharacterized repeat protein (TIGR03803 family)
LESRTLFVVTATPLVEFDGANGKTPITVIQNTSGDLIGVANGAEFSGVGVPLDLYDSGKIFRLSSSRNPQLEILAKFDLATAGPLTLAMDAAGNIYGTTEGVLEPGTIFKLPVGSGKIEILRELGFYASSHLISINAQLAPFTDPAGNAYGVFDYRDVFKIESGTNRITELTRVEGGISDLVLDPFGNLFGTARFGGPEHHGSIFKIPAGSSKAEIVSLFDTAVGSHPNGLTVDSAGNLYGSTTDDGPNDRGTLFQVVKDSSTIEVIGSFNSATGGYPASKPALDNHGNLFGITGSGGANSRGTLYKLADDAVSPVAIHSLGSLESPEYDNRRFGDIESPVIFESPTIDQNGDDTEAVQYRYHYPPPRDGIPDSFASEIPDGQRLRVAYPRGGLPVHPTLQGGNGTIVEYTAASNATSTPGLSVGIVGKVPSSIVSGKARMRLPLKVTLTNESQIPRSTATVKLFLAPDGRAGGVTEIGTAKEKLAFQPGQAKSIKITIGSFPEVTPGDYRIVAEVIDSEGSSFFSPDTLLKVVPTSVTSAISNFAPAKNAVVAGKQASFNVTLTNTGNIPAAGAVAVTASLTTDPTGAGGQAVTVKPLKVKLKPSAGRAFKINLTIPKELPPGSYYLSLALDVAAIGDATVSNGVAVTLTPLTVS